MIKESFAEAGLAPLAVIGLVLFVLVFTAIAVWALSRGRKEIADWSSLPLAKEAKPVIHTLHVVHETQQGGCGKCEDCTCQKVDDPAVA